jgi:hypothetical protein
MRWRLWRSAPPDEAASRAKVESERRLRQARREWPQVNQARDQLAEWIDSALRGRA